MKDLDLAYMPPIVTSEETEDFHPPILKEEPLHHIFKFCECVGFQFIRETFMKPKNLYAHGCKFQSEFSYLLSLVFSFFLLCLLTLLPLISQVCLTTTRTWRKKCFFFQILPLP